MNTTSSPPVPFIPAATLAHCYQLLAMGFAYPDEELFEIATAGILHNELAAAVEAVSPEQGNAAHQWGNAFFLADRLTLESTYLSTFELNAPKASLSLYEGSYVSGCDRAEILLEVKSFYQHFGLSMSDSPREAEDHLTAELEFMQFLTAKQAVCEAENEDAGPYIRAQRDFLSRHLAAWIPRFQVATANLDSLFYQALAWFTGTIVAAHHRAVWSLSEGERTL